MRSQNKFLLCIILAAANSSSMAGAASPTILTQAQQIEANRLERNKLRNRREWMEMVIADSVSWAKTLANKRPDETLAKLQKERLRWKAKSLLALCDLEHFSASVDVDSLPQMPAAEKQACKDSLRMLNPQMP